MTIQRETVRSPDGVEIVVATEGTGTPLLLVHGGMCSSTAWTPMWPLLTARYRVSAIDRRGRGASSDSASYAIEREYDDLLAVTEHLTAHEPTQIDVMGHSIGATITVGAAARGARYRRITLYEPPGPPTVSRPWIDEMASWISSGHVGRALVTFPRRHHRTRPRHGQRDARQPNRHRGAPHHRPHPGPGSGSAAGHRPRRTRHARHRPRAAPARRTQPTFGPPRSPTSCSRLCRAATLATLPDAGHDALDTAPDLVVAHLDRFLRIDLTPPLAPDKPERPHQHTRLRAR